jgi:cytidylate kinase
VSAKQLVIAIDGPAASGKSTTARRVAERLGYLHVDTGAMYRAVTLKVLRNGVGVGEEAVIDRLMDSTRVELQNAGGRLRVYLDGEDVTDAIRTVEVTEAVSAVSKLPAVRRAMVREQRRLGELRGIVLEGRDIGTVVFPDADLKIFMLADLEVRATRRQAELADAGVLKRLEDVRHELAGRDTTDSTRVHSPLQKAEDAIIVDTSHVTIEQQVEWIVQKAKEIVRRKQDRTHRD